MIEVSHLTKWYGSHLAVNDLSFQIPEGAVYGFLGPNGAGKSTTMNILAGCLSPTSGKATICGYDILEQPEKAKRCLGYLPEQPPLYSGDTPWEYLQFVAEAKGLRGKVRDSQIETVMERTGIDHVATRRISSLSKGYKQRVGIAQALLGEPEVVILDEPTVGLDPIQILEIRQLIQELGKRHTVIFSSHILSEVQTICQKVLIIAQGKLVAFDTPQELERTLRSSNTVFFRVEAEPTVCSQILTQLPQVGHWETSGTQPLEVTLSPAPDADISALCARLSLAFASAGKPLLEIRQNHANLESVFLELTDKQEPSDAASDGQEVQP